MKHVAISNLCALFLVTGGVTILTACSSDSGSNTAGDGQAVDAGSDASINPDFFGPNGDATDTPVETDLDEADELDFGPDSTLGAPCLRETDCTAGELCAGADPRNGIEGYCTILDCSSHDECEFGDGEVYCCSDFPGARGCFREGPDSVCGDGGGEQGDACERGGQSDCDGADHYCVEFYGTPFCAQFCRPNAGPNQPGSCPEGNWCFETGGGNGICVPGGENEPLTSCADDPFMCGEGMLCDGAFEDPPSPYSYCATICYADRDCAEDEWCQTYPGQGMGTCKPEGDGTVGSSCAEDRWSCEAGQFCKNEGTRYAVCANICRGERDCERGYYCNLFSPEIGVCIVEGDRETGDACGDNPLACLPTSACIGGWGSGYNADTYCSEECSDDEGVCGDGFYCEDFDEVSHCIADGDNDIREECASSLECPRGTACLYLNSDHPGRCQPYCESDDECLATEWCTDDICLPKGDGGPGTNCDEDPFSCGEDAFCGGGGEAYCVYVCTGNPDICTGDTFCTDPDEEGNQYCVLAGETEIGESCDEAHECIYGGFCVLQNDDNAGVCTHGCWTNNDCYSNSWCLNAGDLNACIPHGDVEQGSSCAGENRLDCAAEHLCFYDETTKAFCARECTGFANICGENERCTHVGWGANFCMPFGELAPGADCSADAAGCDAESLCLGVGTDDAFCAKTCSFDADRCDDEDVCHFFANGLGLCVPPDYDAEGVTPF